MPGKLSYCGNDWIISNESDWVDVAQKPMPLHGITFYFPQKSTKRALVFPQKIKTNHKKWLVFGRDDWIIFNEPDGLMLLKNQCHCMALLSIFPSKSSKLRFGLSPKK